MSKIEKMNTHTGRVMKEDDSVINTANILSDVYDPINGAIKTSSPVDPSTSEIVDEIVKTRDMTMGQLGSKRITTTDATTPTNPLVFVSIQATADTVISALAGNMANAAGLELSAGSVIYGRFTSITLTSGKVIAYMGV